MENQKEKIIDSNEERAFYQIPFLKELKWKKEKKIFNNKYIYVLI
jgi:hypothetical protein